jgi:hypothetical protein
MAELRQIRTLRLRAGRREQVARAAIALEDALRTASLPQLPRGAILLVRRLDLGRLPADASPQWLSRQIETRLRALQPTAVRVRHDKPSAAPLVWFADRSEALAALLSASLHHAPRAWYWPGVLPGWRPGMTMRELLPCALRQAAAAAGAGAQGAGVAALLDRLLRQGRLDAVLDHLDPADVAPVAGPVSAPAEARGVGPGAAETSPPSSATEASLPPIASDAWRAVLTRWVRQWGAADQRSRWLTAHALIAVHGPAAAAQAERLIARLTGPLPRPAPTEQPIQRSRKSVSGTPERGPQPVASGPEDGHELLHELEPTRIPGQATPHEVFRDARTEASQAAEPDWQPSRHGGLLLVLPALARLEIAAADPDGDLCLCLLHRIADRLRIRKDDAIRRALPKPLPREGLPRAFVPPDAWRGLLRLPRGADLGHEDGLLAACQLVLARYLRRHARMSLRRLVHRPALVHATPTHIDLRFAARWVELEVRLAGLDLDPGWVPWLGRVVSFHYDYEGQR